MSAPIISFSAVGKEFGATPVLRNIDLHVAPGEFLILVGGSGSGKTTLLRIAAGLEGVDRGSVTLRQTVVDQPAQKLFVAAERRRLGMVFQDYALWPHMSSLENVQAAMGGPRQGHRRAAQDLLDQVGVGGLAHRRPEALSGGQQQRVGLARALAAAPDLLLLDEPLSSLDVDVREQMRSQIRTSVRDRGAAAIFVSHDPVDAWRLADRVAVLEGGRIVQSATPQALYARPATARVARYTDAIGGFAVPIHGCGSETAFPWNGRLQPAIAFGVCAGQTGRLYLRPSGVTSGDSGAPAQLLASIFEAGRWRAEWRLPDTGWIITSLEVSPPPAHTWLTLAADDVFLYPDEENPL